MARFRLRIGASGAWLELIRKSLENISVLTEERSPAAEIARLRPLWGRYFLGGVVGDGGECEVFLRLLWGLQYSAMPGAA